MIKNRLFISSLLLVSAHLTGCAAKGYEGPDLPSSQLSTVAFQPEGRVSIKNMVIDGKRHSYPGRQISVPAGKHTASTEYQLAMSECPMFSVGCFDEIIVGTCQFDFVTDAGHYYAIELKGSNDQVVAAVYEDNSEKSVGTGTCKNGDKDLHMSVIRRRSTIEE